MARQRPTVLTFDQLRIEGWSRAGEETWFRVSPPGVAFDVGRGSMYLEGSDPLFITHGHLDHALGVPYVLSNRSFHKGRATRVCCPRDIAPALEELIRAAEKLEGAPYLYELMPLAPGDVVPLGAHMSVEAFDTDHVVPSLGYHLRRTKRRLKEAFRDLPQEEARREILARRAEGEDILEEVEEVVLSYPGDTGAGIFALEPRIFTSRVLMLEVTFLGEEHRGRGARYGHLHLEDLVEQQHRFRNHALVLYHLSRRYPPKALRLEVERLLPDLADRIRIVADEGRPG